MRATGRLVACGGPWLREPLFRSAECDREAFDLGGCGIEALEFVGHRVETLLEAAGSFGELLSSGFRVDS